MLQSLRWWLHNGQIQIHWQVDNIGRFVCQHHGSFCPSKPTISWLHSFRPFARPRYALETCTVGLGSFHGTSEGPHPSTAWGLLDYQPTMLLRNEAGGQRIALQAPRPVRVVDGQFGRHFGEVRTSCSRLGNNVNIEKRLSQQGCATRRSIPTYSTISNAIYHLQTPVPISNSVGQ